MTALLGWLLTNPTVLAIGAGVIAALGAWVHGRVTGAKAERNQQAADEAAARDVSNQVQNDVGALPADAVKKELKSWAKQ